MQALITRAKYFKKEVRLADGSLALVLFEVVEINGRLVARAISGEILSQAEVAPEPVLCLACVSASAPVLPIVSPFFPQPIIFEKLLSYFVSQPTRAPNN